MPPGEGGHTSQQARLLWAPWVRLEKEAPFLPLVVAEPSGPVSWGWTCARRAAARFCAVTKVRHTGCRSPVHAGPGGGAPAVPRGLAHVQDDKKVSGLNRALSRWPVPPPPSPRSYRARLGALVVTWRPDQCRHVTYCPSEATRAPGMAVPSSDSLGRGAAPATPADPHSDPHSGPLSSRPHSSGPSQQGPWGQELDFLWSWNTATHIYPVRLRL